MRVLVEQSNAAHIKSALSADLWTLDMTSDSERSWWGPNFLSTASTSQPVSSNEVANGALGPLMMSSMKGILTASSLGS